jgi:hypothetical protein
MTIFSGKKDFQQWVIIPYTFYLHAQHSKEEGKGENVT